MVRRRGRILVLAAVAVLTLGACGDGDEGNETEPTETPTSAATFPESTGTEEPEPAATPTATAGQAAETYEVQQGDTLWDIAQRFGTSVDAIAEANGIEDASQIFPGDELVIPAGD